MVSRIKPRTRRKNHWEPFYNPQIGYFLTGDWVLEYRAGAYREVFDFSKAHVQLKLNEESIIVIRNKFFLECDFSSGVNSKSQIVFIECEFSKCDFGKSWLKGLKFTQCNFFRSSFTQCDLNDSEFRDCVFESIGYAGNETKANAAYFTNSDKFIDALLIPKSSSPKWFNLKPSRDEEYFFAKKAVMARELMGSLKTQGSESEFYRAVKVHESYQGESRIVRRLYQKKYFKAIYYILEYALLQSLGSANSWGKNALRPVMISFGFMILFTFLYRFFLLESWTGAFWKSTNISILAGYSFELSQSVEEKYGFLQTLHVLLSLLLYSTFIASVFGRLTRLK